MNKHQFLEEAMIRAETAREHYNAVKAASYYVQNADRVSSTPDTGEILEKLMQIELDEWRGIFMWGLVADDELRDRVKVAAKDRFLANTMHVANWFNNGEDVSSYLTADEDEFRKMVDEVFKPR